MTKFKMPYREQISNKGTFGKVLNISGSNNYIGAAYLSTISVLKVGAGLVALASTPKVINSVSCLLPEAVYIERKFVLKKINDFTTILIGCGLGVEPSSCNFFKRIIAELQKETKPIVIDADGLNLLACTKVKFSDKSNVILTPHPLEASRLLGCELEEVLSDLEKSAKLITEKYNVVTVLKTNRTVVCDKKGSIYVNNFGNSALAKAGSGDVLAGVISGLLAQGMESFDASKLGVYLHSRAGEIASIDLTEYSVLASDTINYLHKAIKEIQD